jgi:hypothetical protein
MEHLKLSYDPLLLAEIRRFDRPNLTPQWLEIGQRSAARQVTGDHFPAAFDALAAPVGAKASVAAE